MLHRQWGILGRKILEVQKQWWDLESFWRRFFFLLSPPLFLTGFKEIYWIHTIFSGMLWILTSLYVMLWFVGFSENVIDASSSRGETDGNHFVLYCIVLYCTFENNRKLSLVQYGMNSFNYFLFSFIYFWNFFIFLYFLYLVSLFCWFYWSRFPIYEPQIHIEFKIISNGENQGPIWANLPEVFDGGLNMMHGHI